MKKTSFSLLIVVAILLITPLVGYFGTKYVVLRMKEVPPRIETGVEEPSVEEPQDPEKPAETEVPANDETGIPSPESPSEATFITLPGQTFTLIQLASLGSRQGALDFIEERNLEALVFEKDGLFKVAYGVFKDDGEITLIQEKAREVVSDAFKTSGELPDKRIPLNDLEASAVEALTRDVTDYFSQMTAMDDYYAALLAGESVERLSESIIGGIDPLLDQEALTGDLGSSLKVIYQETKDLAAATAQSPEAFHQGYNRLMAKVIALYR